MEPNRSSIAKPTHYSPVAHSDDLQTDYNRGALSDLEVVHHEEPIPYHRHQGSAHEKMASHDLDRRKRRSHICGLVPWLFWFLILAIVIILAAGIGAGVGVGLSKKNSNKENSSPPTSTSPSSSSSSSPKALPFPAPSNPNAKSPSSLDVSCPTNDTLIYTPPYLSSSSDSSSTQQTAYAVNSTTLTFTIHCNKTYFPSDDIEDVQYIPKTNLSMCIQACSVFNMQVPNGGGDYGFYGLCSGLTVTEEGTCQLKTGVENDAKGVNRTEGGEKGESAMLLYW